MGAGGSRRRTSDGLSGGHAPPPPPPSVPVVLNCNYSPPPTHTHTFKRYILQPFPPQAVAVDRISRDRWEKVPLGYIYIYISLLKIATTKKTDLVFFHKNAVSLDRCRFVSLPGNKEGLKREGRDGEREETGREKAFLSPQR